MTNLMDQAKGLDMTAIQPLLDDVAQRALIEAEDNDDTARRLRRRVQELEMALEDHDLDY